MPAENETYFGDPWPSNICAVLERGPTPVGVPCLLCDEPIVEGDRGSWVGMMSVVEDDHQPGWGPVHRECIYMNVTASPGHFLGECSCTGGRRIHYSSYRAAALWCWRLQEQRRVAAMN